MSLSAERLSALAALAEQRARIHRLKFTVYFFFTTTMILLVGFFALGIDKILHG